MKNSYGKTLYPKYGIAINKHENGSVEEVDENVDFDGAHNQIYFFKQKTAYEFFT